MSYSTITEKVVGSSNANERKILADDVNQIRQVIQTGEKDLKTGNIAMVGNTITADNGSNWIRRNNNTFQYHNGSAWVEPTTANLLTFTAGENIAARDVVYLKVSDGKIYKASTANSDWIGVATAAITSGASGTIYPNGSLVGGFSGLTSGTWYKVNASAGTIDASDLSITNTQYNVGVAVSATQIILIKNQLNGITTQINTNTTNLSTKAVFDLQYTTATADAWGIIAFSATNWWTVYKKTSDAGVTWVSKGSSFSTDNKLIIRCSGTATNALAIKPNYAMNSTDNIKFTVDSGVNWTSCTAYPANVTKILCASYTTSGLCLIAGENSGAGGVDTNIWRSTDYGANWTVATTGPAGSAATVWAIDMYDANNGICITADGSPYVTSDAGVNWTSVAYSSNVGQSGQSLKMVSSTDYIIAMGNYKSRTGNTFTGIWKGTTTAVGAAKFYCQHSNIYITNFCKCTNGYYYFVTIAQGATNEVATLFISKDSGNSWKSVNIPILIEQGATTLPISDWENSLVEYDTNKMLLKCIHGIIVKIDAAGD